MREERVTYTELRIQSPSQLQRTPGISETPENPCWEISGFSALLSSWKLIAVVPWFISLGLLVSVGILAMKLTERNLKSGNLTSSQETDQKGLISGNLGNKQSSTNTQVWKCHPCNDNWHQHGNNCYSFSKNLIPWTDCQLHCSTSLSSFLKLNTDEEMDFVNKMSKMQCYTHQQKFWISLHYNSSQLKWTWLDGSAFTLNQFQLKRPNNVYNQCKYIKDGQLLDGDCKERGYCICKKTTHGD